MSYDGWITYNGVEIVNLSRTAQLAQALGIDSVWITPESVAWIQASLGGVNYNDISTAPWYDAGYPASSEFAGVVPLSFVGLDDSTMESTPTEYIVDGGHSGKKRSATLPIVASVAIVASTQRGADYGKRWLARSLRGATNVFCSGSDLRYFQWESGDSTIVHRRNVSLTRGITVTRKRSNQCSVTWVLSFTLTAADPFEYSEEFPSVIGLGGISSGGISSGTVALVETPCPVYDYSPIYDPLYPALVPAPAPPDFYPDGWSIVDGSTFDRFWARVTPVEPTDLDVVPVITLSTTVEARMVRVGIWAGDTEPDDQCGDLLFGAVVTYLPAGVDFFIDGEQKASYVWDGSSLAVRRTDSLVYSFDAKPVDWTKFNDHESLLITLDIFSDSSGVEGDGEVRASLSFVQKSD